MNESEELLRAALTKVPAGLAEHVLRVTDEALRLADIHGVDRQAAKIAALAHDLLRNLSDERLLTICDEQGFSADPVDRMEPILLHGPLAVQILREQYKVLDADVLGAVAAHTTARAGMSQLQKLIFIADKIEPHKMGGRPEVMRVGDLAELFARCGIRRGQHQRHTGVACGDERRVQRHLTQQGHVRADRLCQPLRDLPAGKAHKGRGKGAPRCGGGTPARSLGSALRPRGSVRGRAPASPGRRRTRRTRRGSAARCSGRSGRRRLHAAHEYHWRSCCRPDHNRIAPIRYSRSNRPACHCPVRG